MEAVDNIGLWDCILVVMEGEQNARTWSVKVAEILHALEAQSWDKILKADALEEISCIRNSWTGEKP